MFGVVLDDKDIQYLKGVGPARAALLAKLGIERLSDLLFHFPMRYELISGLRPIAELELDRRGMTVATVITRRTRFLRAGRSRIFEVEFGDESGSIRAVWFKFNQRSYEARFAVGAKFFLKGDVRRSFFGAGKEMRHPETVAASDRERARREFSESATIEPIYRLTQGLTRKAMVELISSALASVDMMRDYTPEEINRRYKLPTLRSALIELHRPDPADSKLDEYGGLSSRARLKMVFNEFFITQIALALKRRKDQVRTKPYTIDEALLNRALALLPFELTAGQRRALDEIVTDFRSARVMNRLLQGDVGSGKTAVALIASLLAIANGKQAAIMAPTEILARQHYLKIKEILAGRSTRVELITSGSDDKEGALERVLSGVAHLIVGTHALIERQSVFHDLGLVVIDEQHRFGVRQRAELIRRGDRAHALIMSATPIPRTLALTAYGDLDLSAIYESPPGRAPIETRLIAPSQRAMAFERLRAEIANGHCGYIVCPLIEESEKLDLKAAESLFESYRSSELRGARVGLMHGRLKSGEKEDLMRRFADGRIDALVATTVVEVGIDVPRGTVMMIENPERFGLAQLHQLRGRVGRSNLRSYCFLMLNEKNERASIDRLKMMEKAADGFKLAEVDLKLRGAGAFFGVRQSGVDQFIVADIARDQKALYRARAEAGKLIARDPDLSDPAHEWIKRAIRDNWAAKFSLGSIS